MSWACRSWKLCLHSFNFFFDFLNLQRWLLVLLQTVQQAALAVTPVSAWCTPVDQNGVSPTRDTIRRRTAIATAPVLLDPLALLRQLKLGKDYRQCANMDDHLVRLMMLFSIQNQYFISTALLTWANHWRLLKVQVRIFLLWKVTCI